jgi:hypothetical protein
MNRTKTYDSACEILAEYFLGTDDHEAVVELAQCVQQEVEDFIADRDRAAEAAWERQQQSLMESGGTDDSHYRQSLKDAGRGHLLR